MGIGRRYYYAAIFFLCSLYCASHYEPWPENGYKPHSGWGNRWKRQRRSEEAKEAAEAEAERVAGEIERETEELNARIARHRAKQGGDGADVEGFQEDEKNGEAAGENLRKRRADTSPDKFHKGPFEPLSLDPNPEGAPPKKKKARVTSNAVQITYDETGAPRIASFGLASGDGIQTAPDPLLLNTTDPPLRRQKKPFCLIHAICRDNDLLLHFVSYLTIPSLISLYAISKPFHYLFNRHYTAFILSCMRTWAPNADKVYPWRCYKGLCIKDPVKRQKKRLEGMEGVFENAGKMGKGGPGKKWDDLRDVPGLRWLQMAVWREGVLKDILIQLATKGLRCPRGTMDAVKRMWFLLDLPLNTHRIALIHNTTYITDLHLNQATLFFLKVDMAFTDPQQASYPINHPNFLHHPAKWSGGQPSGVHLRKILLAERQLTSLWRVLRGWTPDPQDPAIAMTRCDLLRLWIKHKFNYPEGTSEATKQMKIMDIPAHSIGTAGLERTGVAFHDLHNPTTNTTTSIPVTDPSISAREEQQRPLYPHARPLLLLPNTKPRELLLRPDELVLREGIRRKQSMHTKWVQMMLWGFTDKMGKELPVRSEEEWLELGKEKAARGVTLGSARAVAVGKLMGKYGGGGVKRKAEDDGGVEDDGGEEEMDGRKKVKVDSGVSEGSAGAAG